MSSAAIPPASMHPVKGATALGSGADHGTTSGHPHRHLVGNALRAVKVFAKAAFSVAILGEYADDEWRPAPPQRSTPSPRSTPSHRPAPPHRPVQGR
ncbi:hypothetical protein [Streptomyces halobius]|uniref:hypothetical protein n=1 Tax=Streptomyces halobius TaxID=2879846 RepID=UPI0029E7EADD|nr:hypothetical protein [Streptomyces halobius]